MTDADILARLDELLATVRGLADPRRATAEWKQIYKLLQQARLPAGRFTGVVGMRDVAGLSRLVEELHGTVAAPAGETFDPETLKKAMHAFRKRLSLTVLDEESKLGRSPLTKGSDSSRASIVPPDEWPESVWQELVRQGKLRYLGHRFYELVQ